MELQNWKRALIERVVVESGDTGPAGPTPQALAQALADEVGAGAPAAPSAAAAEAGAGSVARDRADDPSKAAAGGAREARPLKLSREDMLLLLRPRPRRARAGAGSGSGSQGRPDAHPGAGDPARAPSG